jgi:hypothetical protein
MYTDQLRLYRFRRQTSQLSPQLTVAASLPLAEIKPPPSTSSTSLSLEEPASGHDSMLDSDRQVTSSLTSSLSSQYLHAAVTSIGIIEDWPAQCGSSESKLASTGGGLEGSFPDIHGSAQNSEATAMYVVEVSDDSDEIKSRDASIGKKIATSTDDVVPTASLDYGCNNWTAGESTLAPHHPLRTVHL